MKLLKALSVVLIAHTLLSATCSKNDDIVAPAAGGNIAGTWKVSLYWDVTKDETAKFSGYAFTFNSNGQLSAVKGSSTVTGTWSESSSKLSIDFGSDPVLSTMNHNWLKTEKTTTSIKIKDDNPSHDERLEFVKN